MLCFKGLTVQKIYVESLKINSMKKKKSEKWKIYFKRKNQPYLEYCIH